MQWITYLFSGARMLMFISLVSLSREGLKKTSRIW